MNVIAREHTYYMLRYSLRTIHEIQGHLIVKYYSVYTTLDFSVIPIKTVLNLIGEPYRNV